jgi:dihydrofolate synthase/folylpolyglutamate synthase
VATGSSVGTSYGELVEFLTAQNQFVIHYDLEGVTGAARALGLVRPARQVVLVGGTNGKGTTSAFLNGYAHAAGLRVGLYTSPHLLDVRERIRVQSRPIRRSAFVADVGGVFERFSRETETSRALSYFEILTLGAWAHFARQELDLAIFEVGLGGRLDATNGLDPDVSIITGIGLDHREFLGETIAKIAAEKAGIMRRGRPVLLHSQAGGAEHVIAEASGRGAEVITVSEGTGPPTWNRALAWETFRFLFPGHASVETRGLAERSVRWPGRRERVSCPDGDLLVDGAHNAEAIAASARWLKQEEPNGVDLIFGLSGSRSPEELLPILAPVARRIIATPCATAPSVAPSQIEAAAMQLGLPATSVGSISEALTLATGPCAVVGSLYLVGDLFRAIGHEIGDLPIYVDPNRSASSR